MVKLTVKLLHNQSPNLSILCTCSGWLLYTSQEIRINAMLSVDDGRAELGMDGLYPHPLHQPLEAFMIDRTPSVAHGNRHAGPAVMYGSTVNDLL